MKKILYVMHVDWAWIKQRPHFIAEELSENFQVKVIHLRSKRFLFKKTESKGELSIAPAYRLPYYENNLIYNLNRIYLKFYFTSLIKNYKPDFIWITFPQLYDYIPSNLDCKIIYDCMDLPIGFDFPDDLKIKILDSEERLVNDASLVLTSSNYLFKRLNSKYQCEDKLFLVRNAFGGEIVSFNTDEKPEKPYKIGYVGTISKWIDFQGIEKTLDDIEDIEYHFIGPVELKDILNHERIKFHGAIQHKELYNHVKNFDCLIVPFKIDEKIKSADPGKIYDYINFNRPIISVYYKGLEYFSKFLYFYSSTKDLLELLYQMINNGFLRKYSNEERVIFLKENSWDVRVREIEDLLMKS
ncbi:MAG: glycosyltransferase family 4 protein [Candidatus Methanofastidiosa archaeon]|nr:glycosyltransferase family 4 protein [Candidatus Methanofastidiosa archaeon]